jgi:hypothetical protein
VRERDGVWWGSFSVTDFSFLEEIIGLTSWYQSDAKLRVKSKLTIDSAVIRWLDD